MPSDSRLDPMERAVSKATRMQWHCDNHEGAVVFFDALHDDCPLCAFKDEERYREEYARFGGIA